MKVRNEKVKLAKSKLEKMGIDSYINLAIESLSERMAPELQNMMKEI